MLTGQLLAPGAAVSQVANQGSVFRRTGLAADEAFDLLRVGMLLFSDLHLGSPAGDPGECSGWTRLEQNRK